MGDFGPGVYLAVMLFLVVLAIVWILLPFAIFGTKPKLDAIIAELGKVNAQLAEINARQSGTPIVQAADRVGVSGEKAPPTASDNRPVIVDSSS